MTNTDEKNIWDGPAYGDDQHEDEEPTTVGRHALSEDDEDTAAEDPQVQQLQDELAEARADLANYRQRKRRDMDDQYEAGRAEVITNLLPALDNILGAQDHGDMSDDNPLTPVLKSLGHTLEGLGLGVIGEVGEEFDPNVHEAMSVEYVDAADGTKVTAVHQRGFATPQKLLRPALVTVTKRRQRKDTDA